MAPVVRRMRRLLFRGAESVISVLRQLPDLLREGFASIAPRCRERTSSHASDSLSKRSASSALAACDSCSCTCKLRFVASTSCILSLSAASSDAFWRIAAKSRLRFSAAARAAASASWFARVQLLEASRLVLNDVLMPLGLCEARPRCPWRWTGVRVDGIERSLAVDAEGFFSNSGRGSAFRGFVSAFSALSDFSAFSAFCWLKRFCRASSKIAAAFSLRLVAASASFANAASARACRASASAAWRCASAAASWASLSWRTTS
mmetsp:Transcript_97764/g.232801  ORF Transcript_97764/g.232801 Transcript_97764/m.232801 type:complete len:263 (-) Transcript_97764:347-1135(-)